MTRLQPGPTQESVWDYPRPPSVEQTGRHIMITFAGRIVAESTRAWRVCETSHPPVYYLPPDDIAEGVLVPAGGSSYCEFKGSATYWSLVVGGRSEPEVAWSYGRALATRDWPALWRSIRAERPTDLRQRRTRTTMPTSNHLQLLTSGVATLDGIRPA